MNELTPVQVVTNRGQNNPLRGIAADTSDQAGNSLILSTEYKTADVFSSVSTGLIIMTEGDSFQIHLWEILHTLFPERIHHCDTYTALGAGGVVLTDTVSQLARTIIECPTMDLNTVDCDGKYMEIIARSVGKDSGDRSYSRDLLGVVVVTN